jgi:hypothetical protein
MSRMLVPKRRATTTITVLVDDELRARVERAALANERSLGAEVRALLREHLDDHDGRRRDDVEEG